MLKSHSVQELKKTDNIFSIIRHWTRRAKKPFPVIYMRTKVQQFYATLECFVCMSALLQGLNVVSNLWANVFVIVLLCALHSLGRNATFKSIVQLLESLKTKQIALAC